MRRATHHAACALALWIGLLPGLARADTPPHQPAPAPKPEPAPEPLTSPGPQAPPDDAHGEATDTWIDVSHEAVSSGLFWMVERFDRFFADERQVDLPRAASFFRWRSDLRIGEDGGLAASTNLRAEVRLPAFDQRLERLRLTLVAASADPTDPLHPDRRPPDGLNRANAGLRLALHDSIRATLDTQGGLLARWPPGWFVRLRLRQVHPLGWSVVGDAVVGFWQTNTGWGTRQDASLERSLAPKLLARLDASGTITERTRGWEWEANGSLLAAFSQRTAGALSIGLLGYSDHGLVVDRYRVLARLRHDVLRRWILLELQPEVEWLRQPAGRVQRAAAIIVRLELQFDASTLPSGSDAWPVTW